MTKIFYEKTDDFPEEEVRNAIQLGIASAEVAKYDGKGHRWNSKKRAFVYVFGSFVAAFVILIAFSYQSPVLADSLSKIPIIGSVFGDSDLIGLQQAQKKGLTIQVGETETINGISVTLDEVLYDQNNITIGLIMESERVLDEDYFGMEMDFTINGRVNSGFSGSYGEEILSSTSRTAMATISVTDEMPKEFDLGLMLQGDNDENWYFSIPIHQVKDITKIPLQHTEFLDSIKLEVLEFSYGDAGAGISFKSIEDGTLADKGIAKGDTIEFKMVDQNGNEVKNHSGGVEGKRVNDNMVYTSNKQFDPIDSDVTELTITPYLSQSTGGGVEEANGIKAKLDASEKLNEQVEFESFKVKIPQE